eukprot:TRINITY_DN3179_c1_g1_i11.p1 TRINITY_DN3179_c1_g1~~TRINITY_DN3179_c1_g1_i11.p1  ORF type:complete len:631 (-),score=71.51 TRINITY_DN3179_c1_g1_i11:764-2656(-)
MSERASKALTSAYKAWEDAQAQVEGSTKELENLIAVLNESMEKLQLQENNGIVDSGTQNQIQVLNVAVSEAMKRVKVLEQKVKVAAEELEKQKHLNHSGVAATGSSESSEDFFKGSSVATRTSTEGRRSSTSANAPTNANANALVTQPSQCVMIDGKCVPARTENLDQWLPTIIHRLEQTTGIQMQQQNIETLLRQAGILTATDSLQMQQFLHDVAGDIIQQQLQYAHDSSNNNGGFQSFGTSVLSSQVPAPLQVANFAGQRLQPQTSFGRDSFQQIDLAATAAHQQQQQQQLSFLHLSPQKQRDGQAAAEQISSVLPQQQQDYLKQQQLQIEQQHIIQQKLQQQLLSQQACNLLEMLSLRTWNQDDSCASGLPQACTEHCGCTAAEQQISQSQDLYCEVCNKTCNSLTNYLQHVQSKRHSQKLQTRAVGMLSTTEQDIQSAQTQLTSSIDASQGSHMTYVGVDAQCREYCTQIISSELNTLVVEFLQTLYKFQERQMVNDPINAKARRRMVSGLREVGKVVKNNKAKCIILAPNIERIESQGGLDDKLEELLDLCKQQEIQVVYALSRKRLGQVFGSRKKMSAIAILNMSGAQEMYNQILLLARKGQEEWAMHNIHPQASSLANAQIGI